jgi:hypothetical protein
MAHARQFFPKYQWPAKSALPHFTLPDIAVSTLDYLAYVLLDLAQCEQPQQIP